MHGDLHPGNIFVQNAENHNEKVCRLTQSSHITSLHKNLVTKLLVNSALLLVRTKIRLCWWMLETQLSSV